MKIRNLSSKDAEGLCAKQEDHFFDRKAFAIKSAKLQKIAVAFANADGGDVAIGLDDEISDPKNPSSRWNGAGSIEAFNQHIQALVEVTPSLPFSFNFLTSIGLSGLVLYVQIEKSAVVNKTADGTVYIRKSAQSLPLKAERILELTYAKGASSFEGQTVKSGRIEDIVDGKEIQRPMVFGPHANAARILSACGSPVEEPKIVATLRSQ